jgi:O-antigen/teichoic acid export membrane protein
MADEDLSILLSSATLIALGGVISAGGRLLERVIIGRALSPGAYGEVSIGLAVLSFTTTFALVGFTQGVPRYISRFEDTAAKRGIWISAMLVPGTLALIVCGVLYWHADFLASTLFERADSPQLIQLFLVAVPFVTGVKIGIGAIRGMENTIYRTYARDLLYPALRIGGLVAFLAAGWGLLAAGYAYIIAAAIALVLTHVLLHRLLPLVGPVELHISKLVRFSLPLIISTLLSALMMQSDTVMLGYFRSSFEVGQYTAAFPLAKGMLVILSSFGFMYLPLASRLDAEDDREEIDRIYKTTTKWVYVGTFPAFVAFFIFPGDVLRIFFGPEYTSGALALRILAVGFMLNAIGGRNRETVAALGYTNYVMLGNGVAFLVNIGLNLLLIPRMGFIGAALASAAAFFTVNVVICGLLIVKFDISPFSKWSVRAFTSLPLLLLPATLISRYVNLTAYSLLPFLIFVGLSAIAIVGVTGAFQPEDEVVVEFIESHVGVRIPLVRSFLPSE